MTTAIEMSEQDMTKIVTMREAMAARIKDLSQRWAENTIALGREFKRARDTFHIEGSNHRPGWYDWIRKETGWSESHAVKLIRIADKFGARGVAAGISFKVLDFLARDTTPEEGVKEVFRQSKRGNVIGLDKAKEIVAPHREYPKPKEANEKAKETGKAILASDGNYYFGTSKEAADAYERKKKIVYGVRDAVETLAAVGMTPGAFLKYADKHQLWRLDEEHQLTAARDWLNGLLEAWEDR